MPANDPKQYEGKFIPEEDDFFPYPSNSNDGPFMTYDKLQEGAPGKPAPRQGR
jgi:hypothetical protein